MSNFLGEIVFQIKLLLRKIFCKKKAHEALEMRNYDTGQFSLHSLCSRPVYSVAFPAVKHKTWLFISERQI